MTIPATPPTATAVAALVLAGGKNKPEMRAACGGIENRALVPLAGRPMLEYVVDALRGGFAGRVLIAGNVPTPPGCESVGAGGDTMIDTLLGGAAALTPDETRLLVVTADIPFLTPAAVADFLSRAEATGGAQFVYPIVEAARCRERFPDMKRTTLKVAEGEYTGGNLALLDPAFLRRNERLLRDAYARRKSVAGLANLLGPGLLLRLLASRVAPGLLPIPFLETAVGRALGGATARAVVTPFPEIGADIDRPADIAVAERLLSASRSGATAA